MCCIANAPHANANAPMSALLEAGHPVALCNRIAQIRGLLRWIWRPRLEGHEQEKSWYEISSLYIRGRGYMISTITSTLKYINIYLQSLGRTWHIYLYVYKLLYGTMYMVSVYIQIIPGCETGRKRARPTCGSTTPRWECAVPCKAIYNVYISIIV